MRLCHLLLASLAAAAAQASASTVWLPLAPGPAMATVRGKAVSLRNDAVQVEWTTGKSRLQTESVWNGFTGRRVHVGPGSFVVTMRDGTSFSNADFVCLGDAAIHRLHGVKSASRLADRLNGQEVVIEFSPLPNGLRARWRAILRDGANYVRQELTLTAGNEDADVAEVATVATDLGQGRVVGSTPGSPYVAGDIFAGSEHPMSITRLHGNRVQCLVKRGHPIRKGQSVTYSSVLGVTAPGQMRRGFLNYVEMERAHPYRPFLHYNSWYDLGYFTQFDEKQCIERIDAFGQELVRKRGVKLTSFLFDDGWDNYDSVWEFHKGFPNGFLPLRDAANKFGAGPGVWLSPWGGYGGPRQKRLAYGKAHGMEVDSQGYALSGPNYYKRFHDVTTDFVTRQGINHFKFDGTGSPDKTTPGSAFDSDFDAAISLISDLRRARPDLFVNLTTGTWPSPFWLRYADSTWRGGSDHAFNGVGPKREQWITYRDGDTYRGVVQRGPLYPINSLMLHGIIYAQHAHDLSADPDDRFRHEAQSYFATGTQLQELYITPSLLTKRNWDDLAAMARWSRDNADLLVDSHWVGGDPGKLEVYGWASWNGKKAILTLRNPSDQPQAFSVDPQLVFELPPTSSGAMRLVDPWRGSQPPLTVSPGASKVVLLQPFEVLTLEAKLR